LREKSGQELLEIDQELGCHLDTRLSSDIPVGQEMLVQEVSDVDEVTRKIQEGQRDFWGGLEGQTTDERFDSARIGEGWKQT
jgi:hypothetical protein